MWYHPAFALGFRPTLFAALNLSFPVCMYVEDSLPRPDHSQCLSLLDHSVAVLTESAWAPWLWRECDLFAPSFCSFGRTFEQ